VGANTLANFAHMAFFVFAVIVFARQKNPAVATAFTVLAGTLFLPDTILFQFPGIPYINKDRVVYLATLGGLILYHRKALITSGPGSLLSILFFCLFFSNTASMFENSNFVVNEGETYPGIGLPWLIGQSLADVFLLIIPFLIGRTMFTTMEDLRALLELIVVMGLVYTVLVILEVVMSIPFGVFQLGYYIYGHENIPQFRYGLTEPIVFMGSGHRVATYMVLAATSAAAFATQKVEMRRQSIFTRRARPITLVGLLSTLKLANSIYGIAAVFAFAALKPKRVAMFALFLATFACIYPVLQLSEFFPEETLVQIAKDFDEERARSTQGRFDEEDEVLTAIGENFWIGWGHYGRIPGSASFGGDIGVGGLDAWWIIRLGMGGIVGLMLAVFFFIVPQFVAWKRIGILGGEAEAVVVSALMLCVSIRMIDLLLNGWWNSLPVFLAGALYGVLMRYTVEAPKIQ